MICYPAMASAVGVVPSIASATAVTVTFWAVGWVPPTTSEVPDEDGVAGDQGLLYLNNANNGTSCVLQLVTGSPQALWVGARSSGDAFGAFRKASFGAFSFPYDGVLRHFAVALRYSDGAAHLYTNGVLSHSSTVAGMSGAAYSSVFSLSVNIGRRSNSYFFGGAEGYRIYPRELTADEVRAIYLLRGRDRIIPALHLRLIHMPATHPLTVYGSGNSRPNAYTSTSSVTWISGPTVGRARRRR